MGQPNPAGSKTAGLAGVALNSVTGLVALEGIFRPGVLKGTVVLGTRLVHSTVMAYKVELLVGFVGFIIFSHITRKVRFLPIVFERGIVNARPH
jgi:hypothetical protein